VANHPQAEKRNRQRVKKQAQSRHFRTTMRTFIKRVISAIEEKKADVAKKALEVAVPLVDRCAQKGVIPKKRAARIVSRLSRGVGTIES
jgi:small subunit ribosomal protein S20